jgi:hypothetical protein
MSAIDFVVRDDAGMLQRGSLASADGSGSVLVAPGQDLSLNLQRGNILSYVRQGQALQITLVDGQVLTVEGFFAVDGAPVANLFISADGVLSQVDLVSGEGNLLYAQYIDSDNFGKWSPDDSLYFVRGSDVAVAGVVNVDPGTEASMLATPLLGAIAGLSVPAAAAAGLGGALLLGGVVGNDDDDDDGSGGDTDDGSGSGNADLPEVAITVGVDGVDHVVNAEDHADGVEISGTGSPGSTGTIKIGDDIERDITVDGDGNWTVTFAPDEISTGEYTKDVVVSVSNDAGTSTTTDTLIVDTVASVTFDADSVETDGTINFVEESDGFVLSGTVEAGSTVLVSFEGSQYTATVTGTTWSLSVPAGVIQTGERDLSVTVDATDQYGNTASTSGTVHVDTITSVTIDTSVVGGNGTVNEQEHASGVTVGGTAEAGATVVVTAANDAGSVSQTVTANSSGVWTATFTPAQIDPGTYDMTFTANSTDLAGNTASASGVVHIDTELDVTVDTDNVTADGVVNFVERQGGITLDGTTEANANVVVTFNGVERTTVADGNGNWSATWSSSAVPSGERFVPVTVTATDAAGNVATTTGNVEVDTFVNRLEFSGSTVEGDDVVNNAEAADGVTFGGSVEVGSTIKVTFNGPNGQAITKDATVSSSGGWTVTFDADEVPEGTYSASISVVATDAAGNTKEITDQFIVDRDAPDAPEIINQTDQVNDGIVGFTMSEPEGNVTVHEVALDGSAPGAKAFNKYDAGGEDIIQFSSSDGVQDGGHLIVTDTDSAGNSNSTLFVLDDEGDNDFAVGNANLTGFNVGEIELTLAEDTDLTLTTQDIVDLSDNDNRLVIHGSDDDSVALTGTATADGTELIDGKTYNVYTLDSNDTSLVIANDIAFSTV